MKKNAVLLATIFLILYSAELFSQTSLVKEKAIYIYNLAREVAWPAESKNGDFVISCYGSGELFKKLSDYTSGKSITGQHIVLNKIASIDEITKCHILFVSYEKAGELPSILSRTANNKTLIITDKREGILDGASISLVVINGMLQYEISTENIKKMGLKYTQNLVDLAHDIPLTRR